MFFLLPFRAKNPPDHFPYATVALIVLNVLIFLVTRDGFGIADTVVEEYALSHETASPLRLVSAMFLHDGPLHIGGNMLFLWVFGASVEGRLGLPKFLALYFTAGLAGHLLHDLFSGFEDPWRFSLGASGAVMGVAGAYLFLFPFSTIVCAYFVWLILFLKAGTFEIQARWIVLLFIGLDLVNTVLFIEDGVAHLAHLGGFGMGFLLAVAVRGQRDTEAVSEVQAVRAEMKDFSLLSLSELETLVAQPTQDVTLVMAYLEKAVSYTGGGQNARALEVLNRFAHDLMARADPARLAAVLVYIPKEAGGMPLVFYLRLASRLESAGRGELAAQLYRRVYDLAPNAPDSEAALFRLASLMQNALDSRDYARAVYAEQLRLFPDGAMAQSARAALQRL